MMWDHYTRAVLTVIAATLVFIAVKMAMAPVPYFETCGTNLTAPCRVYLDTELTRSISVRVIDAPATRIDGTVQIEGGVWMTDPLAKYRPLNTPSKK